MSLNNLTTDVKNQLDGAIPGGPLGQKSRLATLGTIIQNIITQVNANLTTAGAAIPKAAFTIAGKVLEATGAGTYQEVAASASSVVSTYVKRDASANIAAAQATLSKLLATVAPGVNEAAAGEFIVLDPQTGGDIRFHAVNQTVAINTGGDTTAITLNIPSGSAVVGGAIKNATAITGADSTSLALSLTGGSSASIVALTALTLAAKNRQMITPAPVAGGVANGLLTLSGGGDNTPTGGSVQVMIWYLTMDELD